MAKKPRKNKPSVRQRKVLLKMAENGGIMSSAMRESGYSEEYSRNPQKLSKSASWKEMLDKFMPEDLLLKTHLELLNAEKPHGTDSNFIMVPDNTVRLNAAKLGYQVKGLMDAGISVNAEDSNGTKFTINIGSRE